jgi:hypothetical protein
MKSSREMQEMMTQLAAKHGLDLSTPEAYLRLEMAGFDRLVIEKIGQHLVKVGHYYEQQDGPIADPEVIFFTGTPEWVPLEITQVLGGHRAHARLAVDGERGLKWSPCKDLKSPMPALDTLIAWLEEGGSEATDGCWVEPDGICPHGCPSWLLELNLI